VCRRAPHGRLEGKEVVVSLKDIRQTFGKNQKEMADLLGISVRAIQSYEQNWRRVPAAVDKLAYLMLYLRCRNSGRRTVPCWRIWGCEADQKAECFAACHHAEEYCWLVTGNYWQGQKLPDWSAKLEKCRACPVMKQWLSFNGDGASPAE
jgi:DNA-binding XRE family transcriptional regulator